MSNIGFKHEIQKSLRRKLLLPLIFMGLILTTGVIFLAQMRFQQLLVEKLAVRAELLANTVSYAAEGLSRAGELQRIVTSLGAEKEVNLILVAVGTQPARVVAANKTAFLSKTLDQLINNAHGIEKHIQDAFQQKITHFNNDNNTYEIAIPLLMGQTKTLAETKLINAVVFVQLDSKPTEKEVLKTITQFTALFLGILLILIFYSYSLLRHYVVKPIEQIIHQISDGQKIELRKYEAQNYDEISLLGDTLNNALTQAALAYQTLEMQQKELQESRDRFAALITNLPGITFRCAIDKDWTVLFLSGLVEEITGYPASDFLNNAVRSFVSLIHPDDLDYIFATVDKAMNENRPYLVEYRIITRTGEIRWIHERGRMICNEMGQFCFFDGFGIDITNQKAVGLELARSHADLEQFSYAVSHDMRQPLRMVTSYLSLIESALEDKLDEDTRQFLTFAVDGAKRMDSMILSLLDYSRMGRKNDAFQLIASQTAVNEALLFLEPALKSSGGKIDVQGDWVDVVANRDELTRLLQNLIGNALKYHAENEPPLVQVLAITTQNTFRVEVKDSGIGIVPNQIDRLFKVFSRLQSRSRFEGTGVGLALCRKIVEHHGGKIGVESEGVGCGCTFWFELPIATVATSSKPNDI